MDWTSRIWERPFPFTIAACGQFFLLTFIAMLLYPGGTWGNPSSTGYRFTHNFFSDLGMFHAHNGEQNTAAAALFFIALTLAGAGLVLFFLRFPRLFQHDRRLYWTIWLGCTIGIWSGISFIGVACFPADWAIRYNLHVYFVNNAFMSLPVAILFMAIGLFFDRMYPNRYPLAALFFFAALVAYLRLLLFGSPLVGEPRLMLDATAQKGIVYLAVLVMGFQSYGAWRWSGGRPLSTHTSPITIKPTN